MRNSIFILLFYFLSGINPGKAQHCGYDFSRIIILEVRDDFKKTIVSNLKIILLDSLNKPVSNYTGVMDTMEFYQNPSLELEKKRYWFAQNNYVLVFATDWNLNNYKVCIEDPYGNYHTDLVQLKNKLVYSLCTNYYDWTEGEDFSKIDKYKPMEIFLSAKKHDTIVVDDERKSVKYHSKLYYLERRFDNYSIGKKTYSNVLVYAHYNSEKEKECIFIYKKRVIARGKMEYGRFGSRTHFKWKATGIWRYYNKLGILVCKKKQFPISEK